MKAHWISANRKTILLISLTGFLGLLTPSLAHATGAPDGTRAESAVSADGQIRREGRRQRVGRGKSKHHKKLRGTEAKAASSGVGGATASRGHRHRRPEKVLCSEAFDKAKELLQDSRFRAAKEWFGRCARPTCGRPLRKQCGVLHEEVANVLPTVVPVVADAAGPAGRDVVVKMDGEVLTSNLDGTAIVVDPGEHEFTFSKGGEVFATRRVPVEKGQRNQIISVSFEAGEHKSIALAPTSVPDEREATPAPKKARKVESKAVQAEAQAEGEAGDTQAVEAVGPGDEDPTPSVARHANQRRASVEADASTGAPWTAYALAGVGLLGVGGYGAFTLKGRADNDGLAALCKPTCDPRNSAQIRHLYLAADISLGIGVAALIGSTYLFLRTPDAEESAGSRGSHISSLGIAPTQSGAVATLGGSF